jgi:hypothetical protein
MISRCTLMHFYLGKILLLQKVGVTNLHPLRGISPLRFGSARKKLWVICSDFFMLSSCFVFSVVTPLYLAHLDYFTLGYSLCRIQNSDWSFIVRQIPPRSSSSIGICSFGTHKHFWSCDMWNTLCTFDSCGGSSS